MGDQTGHNKSKSLVFDKQIDSKKSYLLKVDKGFLKSFELCSQLIIRGNSGEQPILKFAQSCYKLKHINLTTQSLVINDQGVILQQTSSYLDVQPYNPNFSEIYATIAIESCQLPDKQQIHNFYQLIGNYAFSATAIKQKCQLSDADFMRLAKAMKMVNIHSQGNQTKLLYIGMHLSVCIIRQIIKAYNDVNKNLLQQISRSSLIQDVPLINQQILQHTANQFDFVTSIRQADNQRVVKMSANSILKYIFAEMALAKKQYSFSTFEEVLDEMLLIYMPAESAGTCSTIKELKTNQNLWNLRFEYFIQAKGEKYIYYDYMDIETELTARLKFLSSFKSRWRAVQLKNIFRGVESTENGKFLTVADMLLRKFRKYGEQYEIKFVLPNK